MGEPPVFPGTGPGRQPGSAARWAVVAVVACVLIGALGACSDDPGPRVVVIGDSITNQLKDDLDENLGDARLRIGATNGANAQQMFETAEDLASDDVDEVFVNLGTNDVLDRVDPDTTITVIDRIIGLYGSAECIHLVTVNEGMISFGDDGFEERIQRVNAGLRRLAEADDRVRIIDWSGLVAAYLDAGKPEGDITVETVHPTDYGQRLLAEAYARAADACPDDPQPEWTFPPPDS